jgi:hypothetical protein
LVVGPISEVLKRLTAPIGEFTVVAEIGQSTERQPHEPPSDADVLVLFGQITNTTRAPRRKVVSTLAKQLQMPPNEVYEAIERAKKSVE